MKRNQHTFLLLLSICFLFMTNAYSQKSIVVTGGKGMGTGGSSSYSVGQIANLNLQGSGGSAQEGVQQAYEIATLGNDEFTEINLAMIVYPNPTIDFLNLTVANDKFEDLSCSLFDINGKIVSKTSRITTSETKISMQGLAQGIYFLSVTNKSKAIKTFKIIKK